MRARSRACLRHTVPRWRRSRAITRSRTIRPTARRRRRERRWQRSSPNSLFACTAHTADQLLSQYVPVWAYEFKDTRAPELFNLPTVFPYGATHASELQFVFDPNAFFPNVDYPVATDPFPLSPDEQRLSRQMIRYWTNFVTTLDPNRSGTAWKPDPVGWGGERNGDFWRRYDSTSDDVQALITPYPHPEFGFGTEHQCAFWEQVGLESGL